MNENSIPEYLNTFPEIFKWGQSLECPICGMVFDTSGSALKPCDHLTLVQVREAEDMEGAPGFIKTGMAERNLFSNNNLQAPHKHSFMNRFELGRSEWCVCFSCMEIFIVDLLNDWVDKDEEGNATACCNECYMDTVIGDASGYPVKNKEIRGAMFNKYVNG